MPKKAIKYLSYFLFTPFWWFQLLVPRNKNIWVFGSWYGKKYADNPRSLFEYLDAHTNIRKIWLTKDKNVLKNLRGKGYECYNSQSWLGIKYSLLAKYVIISSGKMDVNNLFINGAKIIQTWHGSPMKKIGLDDKYSWGILKKLTFKYLYPFSYEYNVDYIVSASRIFNKHLASAFETTEDKILLTGYPRNDILFKLDIDELINRLKKEFNAAKFIIYLPTFRSLSDKVDLFSSFNFKPNQFNVFLEKNNFVFLNKGHFIDNELGLSDEYSRIINLKDNYVTDVNLLIKSIDVLLTDYSSIYFDFLLTEKPIVFTPFDIGKYLNNNRELYFDYNAITCGPKTRNWDEVQVEIVKILSDDLYKECRKEMKSTFNKYLDGDSSHRLYNELLKL